MTRPEQLTTLATIARTLVDKRPLPERLGDALAALRAAVPFVMARIAVMETPAWSYVFPVNGGDQPTPVPWPARWTADVLRTREPQLRELAAQGQYLAWPLTWQDRLVGVLELLVPPEQQAGDSIPGLIDACLPLLVAVLSGADQIALPVPAASPPDELESLRRELEAPLLIQPLIRLVLDWVMRHTPATQASVHIQRHDGDETRMLSFALPRRGTAGTSTPTETLQPTAVHLAHRTLGDRRALWHRNGRGLEAGLPLTADGATLGVLVVAGTGLKPGHLRLLGRIAPVVGAALRRAESYHHLVEAQTHLQQIFDGLPSGLALLDSDGRLLRANPAWSRLWGIAPGVLQPLQLVPWDMFEPLLPRLPDPMAFDAFFRRWGHEPRETTFVLQNPHQELHMLLIPMYDSLGLRPSYLLAVDDVTREREVDRLKSEFVSVVSHELRTPLTSILGYTELLQAREFPPNERRELVETVWKQATHLSNLVEDLLNVSRIDAGRITLSRWVLSLGQLVRELTAQLNRSLDQSRHRLLLDVGERLPPVYADRDRLRQVLGNLLSNAIKYSPGGGEIVLHAEVLRTPPPGAPPLPPEPAMLISVRDPGIGIPPEELPRIFERFYRVDNSNTRKIGGTGLGLAITQALVELHGGRIWVESTPGLGSTFFFTLPLATDVVRAEE